MIRMTSTSFGLGLAVTITAKHDESLQTARAPREFVNMGQALRANLSLTCAPTEASHYFSPGGAMDGGWQIAVGIEIRQRHIILCSGGGPICERDGLGPSPAEMQRTKLKTHGKKQS